MAGEVDAHQVVQAAREWAGRSDRDPVMVAADVLWVINKLHRRYNEKAYRRELTKLYRMYCDS